MPRRWLPTVLFVLALAVQAFLPVANGVAAARGVDVHGLSEICLKAGSPGHDHGPAGHAHGTHDCALCQAFCDGVAPVAAKPVLLGMAPVQWRDIRWTVADRALPAPPRDYDRQARAPPSFS
ncbi:DUF2946 family protein [Methylocystis parvus]|uniref:DUF2946 domain-containing protein n=1 Tax=Methylocystis parvus TaxID=134 RepID=A0A6B8M603_9HYPH|nr:DUF2946 family protein [Methylocystis parvus]QGM99444.1 hypothetical protein F7D14_19440 [Methylocystis parvus]WBK00164.1 DUF2946 family protein [Methylocystis parvus OBBP]